MSVDAALDAAGTGLFLAWVRIAAVLLLVPILAGRPLPFWVALPLSAVLSFALGTGTPQVVGAEPYVFLVLVLREAAAGAVLGLTARVVFSIFESAGRLVGVAADTAGAGGRSSSDSSFGLLFAMVGVGAFLLTGGHRALILALDASFRTCALGAWDGAGIDGMVALFSGAFAGAVMIAAPAFAAGLAADAAAAIAVRLAPRSAFEADAPVFRALCVQIAAVGVLAVGVQAGVDFLREGLARAAGAS